MPATYRVHALRLGTITTDSSDTLYGAPRGRMVEIPVTCAAIEGAGRRMLVDTGLSDPDRWSGTSRHELRASETIDAAFSELGWKFSDIDTVIHTHLHYDHCGNNLRFPHAQFYVSRVEWEFACAPPKAAERLYAQRWTGSGLTAERYSLIDRDDHDLLDGLRIVQTPGHSPGHQSVLVNTDEGLLCVAGDAAYVMENLTSLTPMGNFASAADAIASIRVIRARADRILMTHDPAVTAFQDRDFPRVLPTGTESGDARGA